MSVFSLEALGIEPVDWNTEGPTKGIATLNVRMEAAGHKTKLDAGQGAETQVDISNPDEVKSDPEKRMFARLVQGATVKLTALYNEDVGAVPTVGAA